MRTLPTIPIQHNLTRACRNPNFQCVIERVIRSVEGDLRKVTGERVQPPQPHVRHTETANVTFALRRLRRVAADQPRLDRPPEVVVTGITFTDELVPHAIGPFRLAFDKPCRDSILLEPLAELVSLPLTGGFPQNVALFTVAAENEKPRAAGRVVLALELAIQLLRLEARKARWRLTTSDVLGALAHVYAETACVVRDIEGEKRVLIPDSKYFAFARGSTSSGTLEANWQSTGLDHFAEYCAELTWSRT